LSNHPLSDKSIFLERQLSPPFAMLTAADYPTAVWLSRAGVDLILVGDSLANVELGLASTTQVGMDIMLHHAAAVLRGAKDTPVIVDMPFDAYQPEGSDALLNARKFIDLGCAAVKVEWFSRCPQVVRLLCDGGIKVMGHVGLTPQTAQNFNVRGRTQQEAEGIVRQSLELEQSGCFAVVLECVPESLAQRITAVLRIPSIGIGAGRFCDGQVLVTNDMLGLNAGKLPRFVKPYAALGEATVAAVQAYTKDVHSAVFPGPEQTYR
jgi:3-methyl-2-oxobutanoate hydroxymethyltransferase